MEISLDDSRLTRAERDELRRIATRLASMPRPPYRALPEGYRRAIEETYGDCGGEPVDRWQPEPDQGPGTNAVDGATQKLRR